MDIYAYWKAVLAQDAVALRAFFDPDARVRWHNTNECFTVDEFIQANCQYPGAWSGEVERLVETDGLVVSAVHVRASDGLSSFHVTSFISTKGSKIVSADEYWGDDGLPPQWRQDMGVGVPIHAGSASRRQGDATRTGR